MAIAMDNEKIVVKKMPILRPAIEKWNRGELEDQYHLLYAQNLDLKKKNNALETQLKRSNSRIRRAITERRDANNNPELHERNLMLERENRLLIQKLKSLRHQLIVYTQPKAHNTTLEFLTGRSTGRPRSTRDSQPVADSKIPLKSTENQKNSTLPREKLKREKQLRPSSATENSRSKIERRPATSYVSSTSASIQPQSVKDVAQMEDKTTIIRLHREMREKTDHIQELTFNLEKKNEQIHELTAEYDRLVDEFEQMRRKLSDSDTTIQNFRNDATRYNESTHRSIEVIEKELSIIKEENKVLKAANDRLVANSLEGIFSDVQKEGISQGSIKELQEVQSHVQELERKLAELISEKRRSEERIDELESEKARLSLRYKRLQEKLETIKFQSIDTQMQQIKDTVDSPPLPPTTIGYTDGKRTTHLTSTTVLAKLYEDVSSIVDSHLSKTESLSSMDTLERPTAKWRQMYEEVYTELEKVRNMLVIQHNINEKQLVEINLLNDSVTHYKYEYEKKLNELVVELDKRAKHIEILETQIKVIAGGSAVPRELPSEKPFEVSIIENEIILKLTKLTVTENGMKISKSAKPMLFFSLEFFDFELQTTPLLQGPETVFDYSSVYDVIVSNLFIHYIETDGITIELFEVQGVNYEKLGTGTITLKRLIDINTPANISGRLQIYAANNPKISIAILEYRLEVPFNLVQALGAQKRRITASTYLPIADGEAEQSLYNELIIQIHRAVELNVLFNNKPNPTTYIVYQIYDFPPHVSNVILANPNPEYNDTRSWTLPIGTALHQYLKTEELLLYVLEDLPNVVHGLPNPTAKYGMMSVPLFPLARNQKLQGTFSLIGLNGELSRASIDVSIHWKYAYKFNDEDLEITMPIPVKKSEKRLENLKETPKPVVEDVVKVNEKQLQPIKEPSIASTSSIEQEQESVIEIKRPDKAGDEEMSKSSDENVTLEKSTDSDFLRQLLKVPKPTVDHLENISDIDSNKIKNEQELARIQKEEDLRKIDENLIETVKLEAVKKTIKQTSQDSNATYEISDEDLVDENLREQIPTIDETATPRPREDDLLPQKEEQAMPSPHGSTSTESQLKELESLAEELNDIKSEESARKPSVSEVLDDEFPVETPPPMDKTELKRLAFSGRLQPLPVITNNENGDKEEGVRRPTEVTRSLLGDLPNLDRRPIPPPRTKPKAVEFTEPLHSSIPPSETSSYASSVNESPNSGRDQKPQRYHPTTPDGVSAPRVLRTATDSTPTPSDDEADSDCTVVLRIGFLSIIDDSMLLHHSYDGMHVFVEWKFLDFEQELCETPESLELPRSPRNPSRFETERVYELNKRRIALLKQWVELGNRLDFTLVSDPGDDGECDDLGVAQLDLSDVIHDNHHTLTFYDVDREPLATLEIEIHYSDSLLKNFEFEEE